MGNRGKTFLAAGAACILSTGMLIGGMNLYAAEQSKNRVYAAGQNDGAEERRANGNQDVDMVAASIEKGTEFSNEAGIDYKSVPLIDSDTYYTKCGLYKDRNVKGMNPQKASSSEVKKDELTKEAAAVIGLKEIHRLFGADMEDMTLLMELTEADKDSRSKERRFWSGRLFHMEEELRKAEKGAEGVFYTFILDSVTGELYSCRRDFENGCPYPILEKMMTLAEILDFGKECILEYGFSEEEISEEDCRAYSYDAYKETEYEYFNENYFYWDKNATTQIQIFIDWKTGVFEGYEMIDGRDSIYTQDLNKVDESIYILQEGA